jgi:hypothetical protein
MPRFVVSAIWVRPRAIQKVRAHTLLEQNNAKRLVLGSKAEDSLFQTLKARAKPGRPLTMIGDCVAPRRASDDVREGELAARALFA